ncbi:glycosyltransferase family 4 protein [Brevundimonas sp. TWP2-3-2]|uniref:glycosyltransferase family 4 protein n=1 Tax=unclassified Brevundimonas TaxID=2622653 RepID=UPI003CE8D728
MLGRDRELTAQSRQASVGRNRTSASNPKVGFDAHVLDGRFQGSRTVIIRLAQALARDHADIDVTLYCESRPDPCPRIRHGSLPVAGAMRRLALDLPRIACRDDLDALIYQYICAPWSRNSWVVIHDVLPITHARLFRAVFVVRSAILFMLSMIWARRVVVVSQYTADSVLRIAPFVRKKLTVVLNGPSFDEDLYFQEYPAPARPPYILAVGRLERRKNIDLLVRAFSRAGPQGVELIVVGKAEPGYSPPLGAPGVIYIESVQEAALAALYANAALFVYPSAAEGFGLPLLDAVLFGVPTLSSNRTAMPEVGGDLPEYFDPETPDAEAVLARRISEHFGGRPVKAPSQAARLGHAKAFSWTKSAESLANAIRAQPLRVRAGPLS